MEARYPCPVCLGTRMKKTIVEPGKALVVDLCPMCGGVWFDRGEVLQIRDVPVETVRRQIDLSREPHIMRCHSCYVSMDRNAANCRICDWHNEICCPVCDREMERVSFRNLTLDVCRSCKGVWFDRNELAEIWNPAFWNSNPLPVLSGTVRKSGSDAWSLLDGLFYWPEGNGFGSGNAVQAGFAAVDGSGELLSGVPEVAGGAIEAVGEAAAEGGSTVLEGAGELLLSATPEIAEGALEAAGEVAKGVAEAAVEAVGEAAEGVVEAIAEGALEAVGEAAEGIAEAILEFIVELIGSALG